MCPGDNDGAGRRRDREVGVRKEGEDMFVDNDANQKIEKIAVFAIAERTHHQNRAPLGASGTQCNGKENG